MARNSPSRSPISTTAECSAAPISPTAWFRNAFNLSGSIARGCVEAAGVVIVAIAVLLGRNQETRAYAMKGHNRGVRNERKEQQRCRLPVGPSEASIDFAALPPPSANVTLLQKFAAARSNSFTR